MNVALPRRTPRSCGELIWGTQVKLSARGLMGWVVVLSAVGCQCGAEKPLVDPMSLVIEPAAITVQVGSTAPLRVLRVNGEDVTELVSWASDDGALASVASGVVTGVSVGQVRVIATLDQYAAGADVDVAAGPGCADGTQNGTETDVDCGGGSCAPCADGALCSLEGDCSSRVCREGRCQGPTCDDGVRNGAEAAIDCGGVCAGCPTGTACTGNPDCASGLCVNGACAAPTCSDGVRNGAETGTDCGGGTCAACPAGGGCETNADCSTGVCVGGTCSADSCSDGVRNGLETDVDCGGLACAACGTGGSCSGDADCASQLCMGGQCAAPSCTDQRRNGMETGPDCGGPTCPQCAGGFSCGTDADCLSGVCRNDTCQAPSCTDGVRNGMETAVDCGGSTCGACGTGQGCQGATDCLSRVCTDGACVAPSCSDGVQNAAETGVDCGGGTCAACANGGGCTTGSDCVSLACSNGQCVPPSCTDGVRNGNETAADCGGPECAACGTGQGCQGGGDCASGVCTAGTCAAPSCTDGVRNGAETAVDCGGGTCMGCGLGTTCTVNSDCASGHCENGSCAAPFVTGVTVSPATASVPVGRTQAFTAAEVMSDGTSRDVTATASWSSTEPTNASISATGLLTAATQGNTIVRAVASGLSSNAVTVTVTPPALDRLELSPVGVRLPIGLVEAFTATGTFSDGSVRDLTNSVSWSSSDGAVASVAATGRATALGAGTTQIIATQGTVSASVGLEVTSVFVTALSVAPGTLRLPIGVRAALTATALLSDGSARDVTWQATWSSSDAATATVSTGAADAGLVTATGAGSALISATLGGFTSSTTLTVVNTLVTTVQVFPADETVPVGFEVQYAAVGVFDDGNAYDLTLSATWSSSDSAIATVGTGWPEQGLVRTLGLGTTRIGASFGGRSGDTGLTVNDATLTGLSVSPALITLPTQLSWQFRATGLFSDGTARDVTSLARWTSGNLAVATVSNALGTQGRVFTLAAGNTQLTATLGGRTGTAQLRVTSAALEQLSLSPPSARIGLQGVVSFVATAIYADGTALDVTELTGWTSSVPTIATVRNDTGYRGVTVGQSPGTSTITARFGGQVASAILSVSNATLLDLYISPAVVRTGLGIDVQFNLSGIWTDGTTADLTRVATWTSSAPAVAVISNAIGSQGLATTRSPGVAGISAGWAGQFDDTTLTVTNARLTSIAVTPQALTTGVGVQHQLSATATFDDGTTFDVTRVAAWTSSNDAVASVSGAPGSVGLLTAIQGGEVTVTARLGAISGTAVITVSGAALVGLTVTPATALVPLGYWRQLTAVAQYADGLSVDVTRIAAWTSSNVTVANAGNGQLYGGRITGLGAGTATITARFGTFGGQAAITVRSLRLVDVDVTPPHQVTTVGTPVQLTATGTFTDGTFTVSFDITQQVGWKVAPKKNGTVSNTNGTRGVVTMYNASSMANILAQAWEPVTGNTLTGNTKVYSN